MARRALFSQKSRKAPGPDRLEAPILRLMWRWDSQRIVDLVVHSFRLGVHPRVWKVSQGVPIPKPNKATYSLVKSYRTIFFINCLGKVVERVATELLGQHCRGRARYMRDSLELEGGDQR